MGSVYLFVNVFFLFCMGSVYLFVNVYSYTLKGLLGVVMRGGRLRMMVMVPIIYFT
jgi:hypothetical protein